MFLNKFFKVLILSFSVFISGCDKDFDPEVGNNSGTETNITPEINIIGSQIYKLDANGGEISINVEANCQVSYYIKNNIEWICPKKNQSSSTYVFDILLNKYAMERSGSIIFCAKSGDKEVECTVYVQQSAATPQSNEIHYLATLHTEPYFVTSFNAKIISNVYDYNNKCGIITFDAPLTHIGDNAFFQCYNLKKIIIPNKVKSIGKNAFAYCTSLQSIKFLGSLETIDTKAFYDCEQLNYVDVSNLSLWCNISFADPYSNPIFFANDLSVNNVFVRDVVIPNNVNTINPYAFYFYYSMVSVTIPQNVKKIGTRAFYGATGLKYVYCKSTTPPTGAVEMFTNTAFGRKIYVPMESVNAYKKAYGWRDYVDDIVGYNF